MSMLKDSRRANTPQNKQKATVLQTEPSEKLNNTELETTLLQFLLDTTAFYPVQSLGQKGGIQVVITQQGMRTTSGLIFVLLILPSI